MRVLYLPGPAAPVDDVRAALQASHPDSEVEVCTPEAATGWLQAHPDCDAVIVDGSVLPSGTEWMAALRAQRATVPIAVLVAPGDVPGEAQALLAGADATVPQAPGSLTRLGSLLMRIRRRDADPERRNWRLWFAGRDTDLRRAVAARLGKRALLMSLSRDGKLVPMLEDPSSATALVVDARDNGDDMLAGLQRVRDLHPALATLVIADVAYHAAFLRTGADDCLPPGTDVERLLLAVERLTSQREMAAEVVALRARENRLRAVVEYLPEAVVLVAASRSVLAVNLAGLELLGAAEARHVIGRDLAPWLTTADGSDLAQLVDDVSSGASRELSALTRHEQPQRVGLRAVPFQREPGKPSAVLITLRPLLEPAGATHAPAETAADTDLAMLPAAAVDSAEVDALRTRVAELEALQVEHQALASREAALAESDQRQRELVASLEHELEAERGRRAELAEAVARHETDAAWAALAPSSIVAIEQALTDERAHAAYLTTALDDARARAEDLLAQLDARTALHSSGETALAALEERIASLTTALRDAEQLADQARDDLHVHQAQADAARATAEAEFEQALREVRDELTAQQTAHEATLQQLRDVEAARDEALARSADDREARDAASRAHEAAVQAHEAAVQAHDAQVSAARAAEAATGARVRELLQALAETEAALVAARDDLHVREVQVQSLRTTETAIGETLSETRGELAAQRAAHEATLEQLREVEAARDEALARGAEERDAREALTQAHDAAAQAHEAAAQAHEAQISAARAAEAAAEDRIRTLEGSLVEAQQALADLQAQNERERVERGRHADEASALEQVLTDTRAELAAQRAAYETALRELSEAEAASNEALASHAREREAHEAALQAHEAMAAAAREAGAAAANRLEELQQALTVLQADAGREREEYARHADEALSLAQALTEARAALEAAREDADALETRAAAAEEALSAREAELERTRLEDEGLRSALSRLEREGGARLRAMEQERDALRRDAHEWHAIQRELPSLREAERRMVAMAGQLEESQLVRAQALALESEVAELRHAREHAARLETELTEVRAELALRPATPARLEAVVDEETRWLLYDVASIGHLTTTPEARILGANDIAAQLLGHFSRDALQASGRLPEPLLQAAGAFAHRPTRFEVCLQHGDDGPLHWIVGLATPHAGVPATVTWMLIDVSEQRLHARRSRFLRRMEAMTHVLSAATAESSTLVERATPLLDAAASLESRDDVDVEAARAALTRTQALLTQLSGFARKRARRTGVRDVRALLDAAGPVLVHVAGEDVACTLVPAEEPLHATLEQAEFEQFMTALVMAARDALPLGGRLTLRTLGVNTDTRDATTFFTRPSVEVQLQAEGYGAQMPDNVAALQESASRLGATLLAEFDGAGDLRIVVRLARVFVTP